MRHAPGRAPDGTHSEVPFHTLQYDFVLNPAEFGPMGAKGAGELPHVGVAPAYVLAMEQAVGRPLYKAPYTTEDALNALEGGEA